MTLLVRDEEDVLEANLRFHYAQGVDFVIATDNNSVDRTPAILDRHVAEGRLRVIRETGDDYQQARWVTRMARLAATDHGADWVINADADEFWWPQDGTLHSTLAAVPRSYGVIRVPRFDFVPVPAEDGPFHRRLTLRKRHSVELGAPLESPKVCHRAHAEILVSQGNHRVGGAGLEPMPPPAPITVLHFPMRAFRQFSNKIAKGGAAYGHNPMSPPDQGGKWKRLYAAHRDGGLRALYEAEVVDDEEAALGIEEGRLVKDDRLARFLAAAAVESPPRQGPRPPP
jgi:hypothetical protein